MMKKAPTLADMLYQVSHSKEPLTGWTSNALWRDSLRRAKRFVLDKSMSSFLGELSTQAFAGAKRSLKVAGRLCENIRMGARLPGEVTWIEYDLRACMARHNELLGRKHIDPLQMPHYEGWLLMRHPKIETAFLANIVSHDPNMDPDKDGTQIWTFPVGMAWTADNDTIIPWKPLPWIETGPRMSEISVGIRGYRTDRCGFVFSPLIRVPSNGGAVLELLKEWSGTQRRVWALLATINDLPVLTTEVRASRGFMAKRNYHKYLDHRTITLTVPAKQYTKVIRAALTAVHRRGGPVREHWRKDFRRPLSPLCDHEWDADEKHMFCKHCEGRKIWVVEHTRGDTSRGFVTHDFKVTHEKDSSSQA